MTEFLYPMKPLRITTTFFNERSRLENYTLEAKFDGWRAVVVSDFPGPLLFTREKKRISIPASLREELRSLKLPQGTVLDGEIWNPSKRGGWKTPSEEETKITLWDCTKIGEKYIGKLPIEERRGILYSILKPECQNIQAVKVVEASIENYEQISKSAHEKRASNDARSGFIHGVVLKRKTSPRRDHATRSVEHPDWLKIVFDGLAGWEIH